MDDDNGKVKKMRTSFSIWASEIILFLFSLTVFLMASSRGLTWYIYIFVLNSILNKLYHPFKGAWLWFRNDSQQKVIGNRFGTEYSKN